MREAVVLVHGIWMTGLDLIPLALRLDAAGYDASIFRYPSLRLTPAENGRQLARFTGSLRSDVVHHVGHSLGGLAILHRFALAPERRPGRVVLLGSPVQGSAVARVLARYPVTRPLLGQSVVRGLLGGAPPWQGGRDLGVLAGALPLGLGRITGVLAGPHDGTVAVVETRVDGATDHAVLPVSHTGMLVSSEVAAHVIAFLRQGRFPRAAG